MPPSPMTPAEAGRKAQLLAASLAREKAANNSNSNNNNSLLSLSTLLAHAGIEQVENAPMAPPLHLSSTYSRPADGLYLPNDMKYARMGNPTRLLLEKAIFELECFGLDLGNNKCNDNNDDEGKATIHKKPTTCAFSSGMMGVTSIILAHKSPITVILPLDLYHGVPTLLLDIFSRHSVTIKRVNMLSDDLEKEFQPAMSSVDYPTGSDVIVWMEIPSNPLCQIIDIEGVCKTVASFKTTYPVTTVVDATMASPVLIRPLELGADISMHSGTKYLGGHSDVLLGIVTASPVTERGKELAPLLRSVQINAGGVASSMDSWLTLRGLRTLHIRVERQSKTAQAVAEYLNGHELVTAVHYPGLVSASNPQQYTLAKQQMKNGLFGGVLSCELEDEVMATAFAGALQTIHRATSLGGTEALIEHRASIEPPGRRTSPPGLLRISVGLESEEDLIADLGAALAVAHKVVKDGTES